MTDEKPRYPARLAYATFYDTDKIVIQRDPGNGCVQIKMCGKNHWSSSQINVFTRGDDVPEIVMAPDVVEEEDADEESDA